MGLTRRTFLKSAVVIATTVTLPVHRGSLLTFLGSVPDLPVVLLPQLFIDLFGFAPGTYTTWIDHVERCLADKQLRWGTHEGRRQLDAIRQLRRGTHKSRRQLEDGVRLYLAKWNQTAKPLIWTMSDDDIRASVARFCQQTSVPGH